MRFRTLIVAAAIGQPSEVTSVRTIGFLVTNDRGEVQSFNLDTSPGQSSPYVGAAIVNPGTYNLKLAVIDAQGRRGSVEHRLDARLRVGGPFRFGDLAVADGEIGKALMPKVEYLPEGNRNLVFGILLPPPGYNIDELLRMGDIE